MSLEEDETIMISVGVLIYIYILFNFFYNLYCEIVFIMRGKGLLGRT